MISGGIATLLILVPLQDMLDDGVPLFWINSENRLENRIIKSGHSQGFVEIPIETDTDFQRAFSASFDRLPLYLPN